MTSLFKTITSKLSLKPSLELRLIDLTEERALVVLKHLLNYNKDQLQRLVHPLIQTLRKYSVKLQPDAPKWVKDMVADINTGGKTDAWRKESIAKFYLSFGCVPPNISAVADREPALKEAWLKILTSAMVKRSELSRILGRDFVIISSWSNDPVCEPLFYPCSLREPYSYSGWYTASERNDFEIYIGTTYRQMMVDLFMGADAVKPETLVILPAGNGLKIMNFEKEIPENLAYLSGLAMTGSVLGASGTVTAVKIKTISRHVKTGEYPSLPNGLAINRMEQMVNAFFNQPKKDQAGGSVTAFAKYVAHKFPKKLEGTMFASFFPDFKGFTKVWASNELVMPFINAVYSLITPASDKWLSLSNLRMRYLCEPSPGYLQPYNQLFDLGAQHRNQLKHSAVEEYRAKNLNWLDEIDFPMVLRWLRFMCGAGLLELAYDPEAPADDSLEGLRYVRFTALGRYSFGLDKKYEVPKADISKTVDFDDLNCIFTLSPNCPYAVFLKNVAQPISSTRFRITPMSLLNGCESKKELNQRVENLGRIFDIKSSPALKKVIDDATNRAGCATVLPNDFVILRLNRNLPGLVKFLTTDKEIRKKVIFAEESTILVVSDYLESLKSKCAGQGYLLN